MAFSTVKIPSCNSRTSVTADIEAGEHNDNRTAGSSIHLASASTSSSDDDVDDLVPIPLIALPGEPIGVGDGANDYETYIFAL